MKLFVLDDNNNKIYLNRIAESRTQLRYHLGDEYFSLNGFIYTVWDVEAETSNGSTGVGTVIGGVVGLLGGPLGAIIGGSIGAAIGSNQDSVEIERVNQFNNS